MNTPIECMLSHNIKNHWKRKDFIGSWYLSEKFDGVRAIWTGYKLITRSRREFNYIPQWFLDILPPGVPLDGELIVLGKPFCYFSSITIQKKQTDEWNRKWDEITYMIFDTPDTNKPFLQRLDYLKQIITPLDSKKVKLASFTKIPDITKNIDTVHKRFNNIVSRGGEGIMLIKQDNMYVGKRTKELLKYKKEIEGECIVVDFIEGKGKNKGKLGALLCKLSDDGTKKFHVGTGFTDLQRNCYKFSDTKQVAIVPNKNVQIPQVGNLITYQCMEITKKTGIPRLPIFKSIRNDL